MSADARAETEIDTLFALVGRGNRMAFRAWMGRAERPIRMSLRRFAMAVDVESIVQETLLRMWLIGSKRLRDLQGENASLRFAIVMARNLARSEARRIGRVQFLPPEEMPDAPIEPPPPPDPGLAMAIRDCMGRLSAKLREVLLARIAQGPFLPDRQIAQGIAMQPNTFLQNVVRARAKLRACLEGKGVPVFEIPS